LRLTLILVARRRDREERRIKEAACLGNLPDQRAIVAGNAEKAAAAALTELKSSSSWWYHPRPLLARAGKEGSACRSRYAGVAEVARPNTHIRLFKGVCREVDQGRL